MAAYPHRRPRGDRACAVILLLLLAAVALFPVDRGHHHTVAHHDHHLNDAACVPPHHPTGESVPEHGHGHGQDIVANLAPRSRPAVLGAVVTLAPAGGAMASPVPLFGAAPPVPPDVDLHLLGVLRV